MKSIAIGADKCFKVKKGIENQRSETKCKPKNNAGGAKWISY